MLLPSVQNVIFRDADGELGQVGTVMPASSSSVGKMSMLSTNAEVRPTHFPPGQPIMSGIFVPCLSTEGINLSESAHEQVAI